MPCEIFADGFAGPMKTPGTAMYRPSGLGLGPDGALYVSDDVRGRIYRIVYVGGASGANAGQATQCPDAAGGAGPISAVSEKPPEGTNPDAGAKLPVPAGASADMVALGNRIFHGEVGGDFAAVDAKTGKTLYRFRTNDSWRATPMTYSVGHRQYIAGMAGHVLWAFALRYK